MCAMSYAYCRTNSEATLGQTIEFACWLSTLTMARVTDWRESAEASFSSRRRLVPRASLLSRECSRP